MACGNDSVILLSLTETCFTRKSVAQVYAPMTCKPPSNRAGQILPLIFIEEACIPIGKELHRRP